jgi:hypothetical protein
MFALRVWIIAGAAGGRPVASGDHARRHDRAPHLPNQPAPHPQAAAPIVTYPDWSRELTRNPERFGELSTVGARSVLRRYADAWAEAARRRRAGERAGFPRRKRRLFPVRFYQGTFTLDGRRVRLPMARWAPCWSAIPEGSPSATAAGGTTCGCATGAAPTWSKHCGTRPSWPGSRWCWWTSGAAPPPAPLVGGGSPSPGAATLLVRTATLRGTEIWWVPTTSPPPMAAG